MSMQEFAEVSEGEQFIGDLFGEMSESPLSEAQEIQLAQELLEISSEQELEQFLGNIFRGATRSLGKFMKSPVGRRLGGMFKGLAKKYLPQLAGMAGGALGSFVAPGAGTLVGRSLGSQLGSAATKLFEVEVGEFNQEQAEFEVARKFVNLAAAAAKNAAALSGASASDQAIAKAALTKAARTYAPGLARILSKPTGPAVRPRGGPAGYGRPCPPTRLGATPSSVFAGAGPQHGVVDGSTGVGGRWVRRGNKILVLGA